MAAVYLDNDELRGLTELLSSVDLLEDVRSNSIYSTLPAGVRQSFRMGGNPLADNFAALAKLNGIERLADGQVPLVEVLKTAAMLRHDLPHSADRSG